MTMLNHNPPTQQLPESFDVRVPAELVALEWIDVQQQSIIETMWKRPTGELYVAITPESPEHDERHAVRQRFAVEGIAAGEHPALGVVIPPSLGGRARTNVVAILAYTPWKQVTP